VAKTLKKAAKPDPKRIKRSATSPTAQQAKSANKLMSAQVVKPSKVGASAKGALAPVVNGTKPAVKSSAKPASNGFKLAASITKAPSVSKSIPVPPPSKPRTPAATGTKAPVKGHATISPAIPPRVVLIPAPIKPAASKPPAAKPAAKAATERAEAGAVAQAKFPNNSPVPLAPVPTDGKPKKNLAGLGVRDLEHFRELILAKRRELVGDMTSMEREALRSANGTNLSNLPLHMADMGTDNYEQEFTLGLVEKERGLLRELNRALAKIQDGTYGICEGTGKPINRPRLEAQPWARFSIEYARMMERGLVRR
jgi:DnaK suppressor protein